MIVLGAPLHGCRVLLFVRSLDQEESRCAIEAFEKTPWPAGVDPQVVDVAQSAEVSDWYGIVRFPSVAIVDDGMLAAIEHECTDEACQRLVDAAQARVAQIRTGAV